MKKTIMIVMLTWMGCWVYAQTNPALPTPTTSTNGISSTSPTTNGNLNTTGSTSGVNPNGNPGSALSNATMSNKGTTATPVPTLPPNTELHSSPVTPVNTSVNSFGITTLTYTTTINGVTYPAGSAVSNIPSAGTAGAYPNTINVSSLAPVSVNTRVAPTTANSTYPAGTVTSPAGIIVNSSTPITNTTTTVNGSMNTSPVGTTPPVNTSISGSATTTVPVNPQVGTGNVDVNAPVNNTTVNSTPDNYKTMNNVEVMPVTGYSETVQMGLTRFAAVPIFSTYVPDNVAAMLKTKYGDRLYDITRMNAIAGSGQYRYMVRLQDNGVYNTESVDEQGMAMNK